eukprot:gb/GECH01001997.1/.p1 GENE.gb/GECH01001997.1/~~gb/GECH01001997.1/.p1  ORF type:complete len:380 (+),score=46.96 gb/GECH01001997.1/:1-1140(+)
MVSLRHRNNISDKETIIDDDRNNDATSFTASSAAVKNKSTTTNHKLHNHTTTTNSSQKTKKRHEPPNITHLIQYSFCVYVFYILYGYLHESLMKDKFYDRVSGNYVRWGNQWFLVFLQSILNFTVGFIAISTNLAEGKPTIQKNSKYLLTALSYIGSMVASNYALNYINFPTQVLAKSCKMIPVIICEYAFRGRRYSFRKYVCVAVMTIGIAVFMANRESGNVLEEEHRPAFTVGLGLGLVLLALFFDGMTATTEEGIMEHDKPTALELMMHINLYAAILLFIVLVPAGTLKKPLRLCLDNPRLLYYILSGSLASGIGQVFIFRIVHEFGTLACSTVTTTRKFFSIVFSVICFGHPLNMWNWLGVTCVFVGLGIDLIQR